MGYLSHTDRLSFLFSHHVTSPHTAAAATANASAAAAAALGKPEANADVITQQSSSSLVQKINFMTMWKGTTSGSQVHQCVCVFVCVLFKGT